MLSLPKFTTDTILAPMSRVTDVAFRLLCKKYGVGLTMTEMISANALSRLNKATLKKMDVVEEEKPRCVQLFGINTENMVMAAKIAQEHCEMIDLNFGCPAPEIIAQGAGSALLQRPAKIKELVQAVSSTVEIPISCKLRLGINKQSINVLKIAQLCEQAGASMLTIHGRTQQQGYNSQANWNWIKKVKEAVKIPVAGNGDVFSVEDYQRMKKETGCDYVMIGRGAVGNPYIFQQIKNYNQTGKYQSDPQSKLDYFFEYYELAQKYKVSFNNIKFHAQAFTKSLPYSAELRVKLSKAKKREDILNILEDYKQNSSKIK